MDALNLLMPLLIIAIFYFFILRPNAQKQKAQQKFIGGIQNGDEVVTAAGILGKIVKIDDNIVTLQVDGKTNIRVTKNALSKDMTDAIYAQKKNNG